MTTSTRAILAFVGAVVIGGFIWGAYQYPVAPTATGSPAGTTFNTAKIAAVTYAPATSAASSTSLYNGDASSRYITDNVIDCNGVNGQGVTIQAATTTVANQGLQGNTNYAMNTFGTTTTTSTNFMVSSSTVTTFYGTAAIWPSLTYLTFIATSSAFNQGSCTVGVHYLAS